MLEKELNFKFGDRIRSDKKNPDCLQYQKPLYPGKTDWETVLLEYIFIITKGRAAGETTGTDFIQLFLHVS